MAASLLPSEFHSRRPVWLGRPWLADVNWLDGPCFWQRVGRDGCGKSKADWNPLVDGTQQGDMVVRRKRMCVAGRCVIGRSEGESLLVGFRHAVAVPASCDCSSDARRSVWQSSSCSFVYGYCRDTKDGERGRERGGVCTLVTERRTLKIHAFPCTQSDPCTHTLAWVVMCSFRTLSHPGSCWLWRSCFSYNLKHSTATGLMARIMGDATLHNWIRLCFPQMRGSWTTWIWR